MEAGTKVRLALEEVGTTVYGIVVDTEEGQEVQEEFATNPQASGISDLCQGKLHPLSGATPIGELEWRRAYNNV